MYLQACHALGIVPVSAFIRHLQSTAVDLKHHGIGPKGAKAIGIAMTVGILCVHTAHMHAVHIVCMVHTECTVFTAYNTVYAVKTVHV